jgi:uncharacterized membrane protein YfcA
MNLTSANYHSHGVRQVSTAPHRSIEILVGIALIGYCSYSMYRGRIFGRLRFYTRREDPWSFWTIVIVALCIGIVFLFGHVRA